jgi:hypothetical protein
MKKLLAATSVALLMVGWEEEADKTEETERLNAEVIELVGEFARLEAENKRLRSEAKRE